MVLLLTGLAFGQGSAADYARAAQLEQTTRGKVFRTSVTPRWAEDNNSFWYRIETGPGTHAWVFVDGGRGERRPGFDHDRLAEALGAACGKVLEAEALPLQAVHCRPDEVWFQAFDATWRFGPDGLRPLEQALPRRGLEPGQARRSRRTGPESEIRFINRRDDAVEVLWLDFDGVPRSYGRVEAGASRSQHTFGGHVWLVRDATGEQLAVFSAGDTPAEAIVDATLPRPQPERALRPADASPDGRWQAFVQDHDVFLRDLESADIVRLSEDGSAEDHYLGDFHWAPDSSRLLVMRRRPGQHRTIQLREAAPEDQLQPKLHTLRYDKPGDRLDQTRPQLFDVERRRALPLSEELFPNPWSITRLAWDADSRAFSFLYNQRGHQLLRVVQCSRDGRPRSLLEERSETFVDYANKLFYQRLPGGEILWLSERDGWNHLYLFDARGRLVRQLTSGAWVVRGVERVDSERREVWFRAGGIHPEQDPYHVHLCRVDLDDGALTVLTSGDGTHTWQFSPDRRALLVRWSRVDQPPVHELRDARDGRLLVELERAEPSALLATGWRPPQRFVAAGRDGETAIHGIIIRPSSFEPGRRYPVLENIYAGPHSAHVPKDFGRQIGMRQLAELGFIVVMIDGMGTSHRSKAFHDVCWQNLGDAGFPDRIAWLRAAAAAHPELDLERVGIYGGSAGGQNALRGLLAHGDVYTVGVADCGCHDNRMDKVWWNELWMGWPLGPHYAASSNVTLAQQLQGKLLLIVGELDRNVDPASTLQVVDALIAADKDFDLLLMPGVGHGAAETAYGRRRRADFFVRHLWGREPRWE